MTSREKNASGSLILQCSDIPSLKKSLFAGSSENIHRILLPSLRQGERKLWLAGVDFPGKPWNDLSWRSERVQSSSRGWDAPSGVSSREPS